MKELSNYKHIEWTNKPNKKQMPINMFTTEQREEFNEIYLYIKNKYRYVKSTKSGGIPYNNTCFDLFRYTIVQSKTRYEIILLCKEGCFRFQFGMPSGEKNPVSGRRALREVYDIAKQLEIDLSNYAVSPEKGKEIKETIAKPCIKEFCLKGKPYKEFDNVHHLDFKSSYWSRIVEQEPKLRPIAEYMYSRRKEKDEYYKHVLTNSAGCMQSEYCIDYFHQNENRSSPYQFAGLAKIAVDGTYNIVCDYIMKLTLAGRKVLLTNTDGIWYQGDIYHDENEGDNLCQWKNDHKNCKILIKSKGAYQYLEDGKCHTVVRGLTNLDDYKPRDEWEFGDIIKANLYIRRWEFDENKGVIENEEDL